jgi:uncharacterized membrane protein YvbJ
MTQTKCPHCGEPHQAGVRFCPKTGRAIPASPTCPQCGASVDADWQACANCGKRLSAGTVELGAPRVKKIPFLAGGMILIVALVAGILLLNKQPTSEPTESAQEVETERPLCP